MDSMQHKSMIYSSYTNHNNFVYNTVFTIITHYHPNCKCSDDIQEISEQRQSKMSIVVSIS